MNKKSRTEYSLLNIITGLGGYVINTVLGLVCRMVFTRTLSADYLGVNGLFTNILSMLSLAELGIGSAIVYALYKPLAENDEERIAILVKFYGNCYRIVGCVVAVIGLVLMPFLEILISEQPAIEESIKIIYLLYLFNTASTYFFSYRSTLIAAAQQSYIVTGVNYLVTIIQSLIQIVWLFATHNYMGYLVIISIGTFCYNITISKIASKKFPYIDKKEIAPLTKDDKAGLIRNIRALTIWKLSGLLVNSTDNIIITYFNGLTTVGMASNYTLLSGTINSLLNQIFSSIGASVGDLNASESVEKRLSMFYTISFANFWMFGWAAIGIFVVSSDVVALLFGEDYVLPMSISLIIALNFYMVGIQNAVWTFQNAMGLFRQGRYMLLVTATINLVCSFWLGEMWGLFGILLATAISRLLTNTWYDSYRVFKYGFGTSVLPYYIRRVTYLLLLISTAVICYGAAHLLDGSLWFNFIYRFVVCFFVPNVVFLTVFRGKAEFKYYESLVSKMRKRL